jgi:hypothetical protein
MMQQARLALLALSLLACGGGASHHDENPDSGKPFDQGGPGKADLGGMMPTGTTIYCGLDATTECECTTESNLGLTAGVSCGPSTVPGPSLCCATTGWPTMPLAGLENIDCVCSQLSCTQNDDVCICGFKTDPNPGDVSVASCSGAVCCRSRSTYAPECICTMENLPCQNGDEQVPSCGTSDVLCDEESPAVCQ